LVGEAALGIVEEDVVEVVFEDLFVVVV
jgi:hypothetical protein